ncbi:MAG TPA: MMPL family transporter [Candidatus Nanoarchaeia archaeon]|nr:MMPL family transporter [Candidatus Nanoarchaeia archaeon]
MNPKLRQVLLHWRTLLLVACLILSVYYIHPTFSEGVAIRNVIQNSSASLAGIPQPNPNVKPVDREKITHINNNLVITLDDYYKQVSSFGPNRTIQIRTTRSTYKLTTGEGDIGLRVYDAPTTNIRKGLDLQGGTRVLLQPEEKLSPEDVSSLIDSMKERLNVYGLSDIVIKDAGDLSGNQYIIVEIAGATEEEIKDLLAKQGKFEARIGNDTVFRGGQDIVYVGRSANDAGIDPDRGCGQSGNEWVCTFRFSITLSQDAAQKQADVTSKLDVVYDSASGRSEYLDKPLELFLDDKKVDELNIGSDLKGQAVTQIAISGSGAGPDQQGAITNALSNMKRLQTILITGSLPVKLNIVKTDAISPVLGEEFLKNALFIGLISFLSVSIIVFIRYRKIMIVIPILITMVSELIILLGVASLLGSNFDLAAIAGILITIGTGVNDQIVITDEILRGEKETTTQNWKDKVKRAFMIIMLAYAVMIVAMIPLMLAGAGLLKGFAITTIIGLTIGVFITRPAYSVFVEKILK